MSDSLPAEVVGVLEMSDLPPLRWSAPEDFQLSRRSAAKQWNWDQHEKESLHFPDETEKTYMGN